jgi:hypothetical protein
MPLGFGGAPRGCAGLRGKVSRSLTERYTNSRRRSGAARSRESGEQVLSPPSRVALTLRHQSVSRSIPPVDSAICAVEDSAPLAARPISPRAGQDLGLDSTPDSTRTPCSEGSRMSFEFLDYTGFSQVIPASGYSRTRLGTGVSTRWWSFESAVFGDVARRWNTPQ